MSDFQSPGGASCYISNYYLIISHYGNVHQVDSTVTLLFMTSPSTYIILDPARDLIMCIYAITR